MITEEKNVKLIPAGCKEKGCPLSSQCSRLPTEVVGLHRISVLFVGEGGGRLEGQMRRPFVGIAGTTIRKVIDRVKKNTNNNFSYALSNICRFAPGYEEESNRPPTPEELSFCLRLLKRDIVSLNPKFVVLLGGAAHGSLFPKMPISKARKLLRTVTIDNKGYKCLSTFHPSYGMRNPDALGSIVQDLENLLGKPRPLILSEKKRTRI